MLSPLRSVFNGTHTDFLGFQLPPPMLMGNNPNVCSITVDEFLRSSGAGSARSPLPTTSREQMERILKPDRYQLEAVDVVLRGIKNPVEAWKILQTSGLIPRDWFVANNVCFVEGVVIASTERMPAPYPGEISRKIVRFLTNDYITIECSQPSRMDLIRALASDPDGITASLRLMQKTIDRFKQIMKDPFNPKIVIEPNEPLTVYFMGELDSGKNLEADIVSRAVASLSALMMTLKLFDTNVMRDGYFLPSDKEDYILEPRTPENNARAIPGAFERLIRSYKWWKEGVVVPEIPNQFESIFSYLKPELIGKPLPANPFEPLVGLNGVLSRGYVPGRFLSRRGESDFFPLLVPLIT